MGRRKHISWKTKYASALLKLGDIPYSDAKLMTEDQIISLYHIDHNILHETGDPRVDLFWNLEPKLIAEHRTKTRTDLGIIAKGRRIRREGHMLVISPQARQELRDGNPVEVLREVYAEALYEGKQQSNKAWVQEASRPGGAVQWNLPPRKLRSRGFDKRYKRKMDGTVVKREP